MRNERPTGDLCSRVCRNIAEEKVGDISFEDDDLAVVRENPGEHADRSLQDRDDRKHCGYAEGYSRHADQRADTMATQVGHDQLEKDHGLPPSASAQESRVTLASSCCSSPRSLSRKSSSGRETMRLRSALSPRSMNRVRRRTAPITPMTAAMFGRPSTESRAEVFPDCASLCSTSLRSSTI